MTKIFPYFSKTNAKIEKDTGTKYVFCLNDIYYANFRFTNLG